MYTTVENYNDVVPDFTIASDTMIGRALACLDQHASIIDLVLTGRALACLDRHISIVVLIGRALAC